MLLSVPPVFAQEGHQHWVTALGGGWQLLAMGQAHPIVTVGAPGRRGSPLHGTELHLTQPAAMINVFSPGERIVVRFTPNFEGLVLRDGERTFGAWGEGFIDGRHPHTYLHELMLSWNLWDAPSGTFSLSAGRGFAAYGTDDPMARPVIKYPTNHHLSQILERWTVNAQYLFDNGASIEAAIFDGNEPEHSGDAGNFRAFPNSWSTRAALRLGDGSGAMAVWELSASLATVREDHGNDEARTRLANVALRHDGLSRSGRIYGLLEVSRSWPEDHGGFYSLLGELQLERAQRQPYVRLEHATRPEYQRLAARGDDFFRYDHQDHAVGATRWTIVTLGYGHRISRFPFAAKPFIEVQHHAVSRHRGPAALRPDQLFAASRFWSVSGGLRVFLGTKGPMRMGSYGALDAMTAAHRTAAHPHVPADDHGLHHGH
jgi:hypothetical protein